MIKDYKNMDHCLLPGKKGEIEKGRYDLYPAFKMDSGKIKLGFETLASYIQNEKNIIIDVFYDDSRNVLDAELVKLGKRVNLIDVSCIMNPEKEIDQLLKPFLGGNDPLFGTRATIRLVDFFDQKILNRLNPAT